MKVDLIKNNYLDVLDSKIKQNKSMDNLYQFRENNTITADNSKKNLNRGYYGGSFTGLNGATVSSTNTGKNLLNKIFQSDFFNKTLRNFEMKTAVANTVVALVVAGMLRPATNLAMSNKDDRVDSIYAASHAISSAVIGFIVSWTVMKPFDDAFEKIKNTPEEYLKDEKLLKTFNVKSIGKRRLQLSREYNKLSKIAQMAVDTIALGIPKACLTIALIPPILKYVFHIEKSTKHNDKPVDIKLDKTNVPSFKNFMEGVK